MNKSIRLPLNSYSKLFTTQKLFICDMKHEQRKKKESRDYYHSNETKKKLDNNYIQFAICLLRKQI